MRLLALPALVAVAAALPKPDLFAAYCRVVLANKELAHKDSFMSALYPALRDICLGEGRIDIGKEIVGLVDIRMGLNQTSWDFTYEDCLSERPSPRQLLEECKRVKNSQKEFKEMLPVFRFG